MFVLLQTTEEVAEYFQNVQNIQTVSDGVAPCALCELWLQLRVFVFRARQFLSASCPRWEGVGLEPV